MAKSITFYFLGNLLVGQKTFLYIVAALIVKVCVESAYAVADPGIVNFEQGFNYTVNIFIRLDILNKALIHFTCRTSEWVYILFTTLLPNVFTIYALFCFCLRPINSIRLQV